MTSTATSLPSAAAARPHTPHDIHHQLLVGAEQVADHLELATLQLIRARHRERFPDCPASRREGVNQ